MIRHQGRATAESLWRQEVGRRLGGYEKKRATGATPGEEALDLLAPEWALFDNPKSAPPTDDFRLREVPVSGDFSDVIRRVVLADRLRVVTAMCGFTRIDAPDSGVAGDLEKFESAPLSRQTPEWVPAAEAHGEGIFVQLPEEQIGRGLNAWPPRHVSAPSSRATCAGGNAATSSSALGRASDTFCFTLFRML